MIGDYLEQFSYDYLMQLALSFVDDDLDKREGSVIYDALAPFCQVLAGQIMELKNFYKDTFALTAEGEGLDNRVAESGMARYPATHAIKKAYFADAKNNPMNVEIGSRFSTVSDTSPIVYKVIRQYTDEGGGVVAGTYELECEVPGTIGNEYSGNLINITFIQGLSVAEMGTTLVPARDTETDDELRKRYFDRLKQKAFGGNIADYREKVLALSGVGAVQIYPTWDGGGTVKLSILDPTYQRASEEFIRTVQEEMDPENMAGETGLGLGIAPIGHKVTVTTPDSVEINVRATVQLVPGYSVGQVEGPISAAISAYLASLRKDWDKAVTLNEYSVAVYLARISSIIMNVPGVMNIRQIYVNDSEEDLILQEDGNVQQIPVMGEVVISV